MNALYGFEFRALFLLLTFSRAIETDVVLFHAVWIGKTVITHLLLLELFYLGPETQHQRENRRKEGKCTHRLCEEAKTTWN